MKTRRHRWIAALLLPTILFTSCQALGMDGDGWQMGQLLQSVLGRFGQQENGPLTASGTIQAEEIRIASELGGRIVDVYVEQGDLVRAGDVLVRLDDTPLTSRLLEAQAAIAVAEADLAVVKAGARVEETMAMEAMLALAEAQRDGAQAAWKNALEALSDPQALNAQIANAQTKVKLAEQAAALAEAELAKQRLIQDQKRKGTAERDIADWQVTAAEENLAAAQADWAAAQTLLNGLWAIRSEPLALIVQANTAQGQYEIAEAGVAIAQAQLGDLLAGSTPEEIDLAEQTVRLEQAKANVIRSQRKKFALASPIDGVVLERVLCQGELAAPAATILIIADLSHLMLTVYVPANQVGHVQLGQTVKIEVDSFPDEVFAGMVTRIGDQPEYTPRNIATKEERANTFYAVEIGLVNEAGLLKPGMPADATFGNSR
jgi:HlyD family secretion protein